MTATASDYEHLQSLGEVVRRPELALVEVIVQDEYTHDIVLRAPTGFVVFDAT
nr:hypothetical protein [Kofleriaceae bacterium]